MLGGVGGSHVLSLPKGWIADVARRTAAGVPEQQVPPERRLRINA